jgi:hypothetical protein
MVLISAVLPEPVLVESNSSAKGDGRFANTSIEYEILFYIIQEDTVGLA